LGTMVRRTFVILGIALLCPACRTVDTVEPVKGDPIVLLEGSDDHAFNRYGVTSASNPRKQLDLDNYLFDAGGGQVTEGNIAETVKYSPRWHNEGELKHSAWKLVADQDPRATAWVVSVDPLVVAIGTQPKPPGESQAPYVVLPTASDLGQTVTRLVVSPWFTAPERTAAAARQVQVHEPRRIIELQQPMTLEQVRAQKYWLK
jgi:hypothetical protein